MTQSQFQESLCDDDNSQLELDDSLRFASNTQTEGAARMSRAQSSVLEDYQLLQYVDSIVEDGSGSCDELEPEQSMAGAMSRGGSACSNDESQTRQPGTRSGGGSDGMDEAQSSGSQMQSKV